eukprot:gene4918-34688_t
MSVRILVQMSATPASATRYAQVQHPSIDGKTTQHEGATAAPATPAYQQEPDNVPVAPTDPTTRVLPTDPTTRTAGFHPALVFFPQQQAGSSALSLMPRDATVTYEDVMAFLQQQKQHPRVQESGGIPLRTSEGVSSLPVLLPRAQESGIVPPRTSEKVSSLPGAQESFGGNPSQSVNPSQQEGTQKVSGQPETLYGREAVSGDHSQSVYITQQEATQEVHGQQETLQAYGRETVDSVASSSGRVLIGSNAVSPRVQQVASSGTEHDNQKQAELQNSNFYDGRRDVQRDMHIDGAENQYSRRESDQHSRRVTVGAWVSAAGDHSLAGEATRTDKAYGSIGSVRQDGVVPATAYPPQPTLPTAPLSMAAAWSSPDPPLPLPHLPRTDSPGEGDDDFYPLPQLHDDSYPLPQLYDDSYPLPQLHDDFYPLPQLPPEELMMGEGSSRVESALRQLPHGLHGARGPQAGRMMTRFTQVQQQLIAPSPIAPESLRALRSSAAGSSGLQASSRMTRRRQVQQQQMQRLIAPRPFAPESLRAPRSSAGSMMMHVQQRQQLIAPRPFAPESLRAPRSSAAAAAAHCTSSNRSSISVSAAIFCRSSSLQLVQSLLSHCGRCDLLQVQVHQQLVAPSPIAPWSLWALRSSTDELALVQVQQQLVAPSPIAPESLSADSHASTASAGYNIEFVWLILSCLLVDHNMDQAVPQAGGLSITIGTQSSLPFPVFPDPSAPGAPTAILGKHSPLRGAASLLGLHLDPVSGQYSPSASNPQYTSLSASNRQMEHSPTCAIGRLGPPQSDSRQTDMHSTYTLPTGQGTPTLTGQGAFSMKSMWPGNKELDVHSVLGGLNAHAFGGLNAHVLGGLNAHVTTTPAMRNTSPVKYASPLRSSATHRDESPGKRSISPLQQAWLSGSGRYPSPPQTGGSNTKHGDESPGRRSISPIQQARLSGSGRYTSPPQSGGSNATHGDESAGRRSISPLQQARLSGSGRYTSPPQSGGVPRAGYHPSAANQRPGVFITDAPMPSSSGRRYDSGHTQNMVPHSATALAWATTSPGMGRNNSRSSSGKGRSRSASPSKGLQSTVRALSSPKSRPGSSPLRPRSPEGGSASYGISLAELAGVSRNTSLIKSSVGGIASRDMASIAIAASAFPQRTPSPLSHQGYRSQMEAATPSPLSHQGYGSRMEAAADVMNTATRMPSLSRTFVDATPVAPGLQGQVYLSQQRSQRVEASQSMQRPSAAPAFSGAVGGGGGLSHQGPVSKVGVSAGTGLLSRLGAPSPLSAVGEILGEGLGPDDYVVTTVTAATTALGTQVTAVRTRGTVSPNASPRSPMETSTPPPPASPSPDTAIAHETEQGVQVERSWSRAGTATSARGTEQMMADPRQVTDSHVGMYNITKSSLYKDIAATSTQLPNYPSTQLPTTSTPLLSKDVSLGYGGEISSSFLTTSTQPLPRESQTLVGGPTAGGGVSAGRMGGFRATEVAKADTAMETFLATHAVDVAFSYTSGRGLAGANEMQLKLHRVHTRIPCKSAGGCSVSLSSRQVAPRKGPIARCVPQDSDDAPLSALGDWRDFRNKLISDQGTSSGGRESADNLRLLEIQNARLAAEGTWAHSTGTAEQGGILLATFKMQEVRGYEQLWQAVVLLIQHGKEGSIGLLLNRPTSLQFGRKPGGLPFEVENAPGNLQQVFATNRVYCGGFTAQTMMHVLHGHNLPGAVEVVPGVFVGGEAAASAKVEKKELPADDFRFFAAAALAKIEKKEIPADDFRFFAGEESTGKQLKMHMRVMNNASEDAFEGQE